MPRERERERDRERERERERTRGQRYLGDFGHDVGRGRDEQVGDFDAGAGQPTQRVQAFAVRPRVQHDHSELLACQNPSRPVTRVRTRWPPSSMTSVDLGTS